MFWKPAIWHQKPRPHGESRFNRYTGSAARVAARRRLIVFAVAFAGSFIISLRACPAQVPIPIPIASQPALPHGVAVKRVLGFNTAPVSYADKTLFDIAAPPATPTDIVAPIELRIDIVEENLRRIIPPPETIFDVSRSRFDASTFRVEKGTENGYPTLYATDARRADIAPILTVTEADVAVHHVSANQLADQWRNILQQTLAPAVTASAPERVAGELRKTPYVALVAVALTWLMLWVRSLLQRRSGMLKAEAAEIDSRPEGDATLQRLRIRRRVVEGARWLLGWGVFLLWFLVVLWILTIIPLTRGPATTMSRRIALTAALWFGIVVLNYLSGLALIGFSPTWGVNPFLSIEGAARMALRRPTIVGAVNDLKSGVLYLIGAAVTLSMFSISPTSALTIGAIIAFMLSFAAQGIVKDYVTGFLILVEDQFAVGDLVTINGVTGTVASLTPRITQIRTDTGTLVTLSNGTITMAEKRDERPASRRVVER